MSVHSITAVDDVAQFGGGGGGATERKHENKSFDEW